MEAEKANEGRSSTKDAVKQAELAFKLYDKVVYFYFSTELTQTLKKLFSRSYLKRIIWFLQGQGWLHYQGRDGKAFKELVKRAG